MHVFLILIWKMAVCNPSQGSGITGLESPIAVQVPHGQLYQLPLQMSLAPCCISSLLYTLLSIFHYMSSYFPSIFSIVAALSAENMEETSSHSHKSVGSNILIYTSKSFSDPLGPADAHKAFAH